MRHGSAARTGRACKPVPLWIVRRCSALAPRRKRQSVCDCIRLPPVPKHPGTAHPCAFAVFPCLGPAISGCFGSAMQSRFCSCVSFVRAPKRKRPRVLEPEGVRVASGDRGDRSPRCERISRWWWCRDNSACCEVAVHRAVRTRAGPHRAWAMAAVQRCGRNASWNSCVRRIAGRRGGAPYARLFRLATKFLHHRRAAEFLQPGGKQHSARSFRFDASHRVRDCRVFRPRKSPHRCGLLRFHPTGRLT